MLWNLGSEIVVKKHLRPNLMFAYLTQLTHIIIVQSDFCLTTMLTTKVLIVDASHALNNNSQALRDIRHRFPTVQNLFHFRKSHFVHIIAPASAQRDAESATQAVLREFGEPLHFTDVVTVRFAHFVAFKTFEEVARLLNSLGIFGPDEQFVGECGGGHPGWQVQGPLYGVCAASAYRRRFLMEACVQAVNSTYSCTFALAPPGPYGHPLSTRLLQESRPLPCTSANTVTSSNCCHLPGPAALPGSPCGGHQPLSPVCAQRLPAASRRLTTSLQQPQPSRPTPGVTGGVAATTSALVVAQADTPQLNPLLDPEAASTRWSLVTNHNTVALVGTREQAPVPDPMLQDDAAPLIEPLPQASAETRAPRGDACPKSEPTKLLPSDCVNDSSAGFSRGVRVPQPSDEIRKALIDMCHASSISIELSDGVDDGGRAFTNVVAEAAGRNSASSTSMRDEVLTLLGEDYALSQCGAGPIVCAVVGPTPLQRKFLQRKGASAMALASLQRALIAACGRQLRFGERIEVLDVREVRSNNSSSVITIELAFSLYGLRGRCLSERVRAIKSSVNECLANVTELQFGADENDNNADSSSDHFTSAMFSLLADRCGVYVLSREYFGSGDDDLVSAVVAGLPSAITSLRDEVRARRGCPPVAQHTATLGPCPIKMLGGMVRSL